MGITLSMIPNPEKKYKPLLPIFAPEDKNMYKILLYKGVCPAVNTKVKSPLSSFLLYAASVLSGALCGFLGTGGGMLLLFSLRFLHPDEEKENMAICTACVLLFSILTTILYKIEGHMDGVGIALILLPSLLGGAVGSLLLGRIHLLFLDLVLSLLLVYAGLSLILG